MPNPEHKSLLSFPNDSNPPASLSPLAFPPEILNQILAHLPRSSILAALLVSRNWHFSALPYLFTNISIRSKEELASLNRQWRLTNGRYGYMVRRFALLKSRSATWTVTVGGKCLTVHRPVQELHSVDWEEPEWDKEEETTSKEAEWLSTVEDADVIPILRDCSNLVHLHLNGCERLSDQVIYTIADFISPVALQTLHLAILRGITSTSLSYLFSTRQFSQIEDIDLSYCIKLTDDTILALAEASGRSLRLLKVDSISAITDASLRALAAHASSLENLSLTRCWKLTNEPLPALAFSCPHLQRLSVAYCRNINQDGLGIIVQMLKELKWLNVTECGVPAFLRGAVVESWRRGRPGCAFVDGTGMILSMG